MTDFQRFKKKYHRRRFERIYNEIMLHVTADSDSAGGAGEVEAVKQFYADVEKMLETRDKIIREYRDKEKLEMAKSRLALGKSLHSRLGEDAPLDIDVIGEIKEKYTGMRARGKPGKRSKRKRSKRKKKTGKKRSK